ncbi:MAG: hypothetical protein ABR518_06105 [Actinomycetota bacterium]
MRKALLVVLIGTVVTVMLAGPASAAPSAPRAKAVSASQAPAQQQPEPFCINIDRDNKFACFFGATPAEEGCRKTPVALGTLLVIYRCAPANPNPPGEMCINIERDRNIACFLGATPGPNNQECRPIFGVPGVVVYYRCAQNERSPGVVERVVRRIIPRSPVA